MIKKITAIAVMAMLCLGFWAKGQGQNDIKALKLGEMLPASFWLQPHQVLRNGKITIETLGQYKGKPLLLDFWATWCSSCITKFKLLDSIARKLQLPIVLVNSQNTGDKPEGISRCLAAVDKGSLSLPTLYADTLLQAYFPYYLLPHYVWIDAYGRLQALTGMVQLNRESLEIFAAEKIRPRKSKNVTTNAPKK